MKITFNDKFFFLTITTYLLLLSRTNAQVEEVYPGYQAFPDSSLIYQTESRRYEPYRLPLGTLKRKDGRLNPENEKKITGLVKYFTYEIGRDYSPLEVYQHYYDFFVKQKKYQILYHCKARECGSNNHWANVIFGQRVLNGIVDTQQYWALKATDASDADFVAFYFVQRGNKKNYVHLEIIDVPGGALDSVESFANFFTTGYVDLEGLKFAENGVLLESASQAVLQMWLRWLAQNSAKDIGVVVHLRQQGGVSTEEAIEISQRAAESFIAFTLSHIDLQNRHNLVVKPYGLGNLVPEKTRGHSQPFLLELVNLTP